MPSSRKTNNGEGRNTSKPKRQVQVFHCPTGFPISTKSTSRKRPLLDSQAASRKTGDISKEVTGREKLLDWHDTAKEVRAYGATAFVGKQKRNFEDEQYFALTGRHKKKQKVPLPILRGLKKAAAKRDAKAREEARQAGIILPRAPKESKTSDSTYKHYGPAPSIGFMKDGVFRVSSKKRR